MKKLGFAFLLFLLALNAHAYSWPPKFATITKVTLDRGFPVSKGEVTFQEPCGATNPRVEISKPIISDRMGGEITYKVRVRIDFDTAIRCVRATSFQKLSFEIKNMMPIRVIADNDFTNTDQQREVEELAADNRVVLLLTNSEFQQALTDAKLHLLRGFRIKLGKFTSEKVSLYSQIVRVKLTQQRVIGFGRADSRPIGEIKATFSLPMDAGYQIHNVEFVPAN